VGAAAAHGAVGRGARGPDSRSERGAEHYWSWGAGLRLLGFWRCGSARARSWAPQL